MLLLGSGFPKERKFKANCLENPRSSKTSVVPEWVSRCCLSASPNPTTLGLWVSYIKSRSRRKFVPPRRESSLGLELELGRIFRRPTSEDGMCVCVHDSVDEINLAVDYAPRAWENGWRLRLAPGYLTGGLWTCPSADTCLFCRCCCVLSDGYMTGKFIRFHRGDPMCKGGGPGSSEARECLPRVQFQNQTVLLSRCHSKQKVKFFFQ